MCQDFKNNLTFFNKEGQFGSLRHPDGYGAPRYIGCSLNNIANDVFLDNDLLDRIIDEGSEIEPKYFLPIIPLILVNGTSGIAVGFASNILNRNPKDIIDVCITYLKTSKIKSELKPFIKGFNGEILQGETNLKWLFKGIYEIINHNTIRIKEYCHDMSYEKIESHLYSLVEKGKILSYENNTKETIDILIKFKLEELQKYSDSDLRKLFKLDSSEVENLTVLDEFGKLKIFENVYDIVKYFMEFRLKYYTIRKNKIVQDLQRQLSILENKIKFINLYNKGKIKISNIQKIIIVKQLEELNFLKIDESFDYLLNLPLYSLTLERADNLKKDFDEKRITISKILDITEVDMYLQDLANLKSKLK